MRVYTNVLTWRKKRVVVAAFTATVSSIHCTKHKVLNGFFFEFMTLQFLVSFFNKQLIFEQRTGFDRLWGVKIQKYRTDKSGREREKQKEQKSDRTMGFVYEFFAFSLSTRFLRIILPTVFSVAFSSKPLRSKNKVIKYSINFDTTRYGRLIIIIMWFQHSASANASNGQVYAITFWDFVLLLFLLLLLLLFLFLSVSFFCIEITAEFKWWCFDTRNRLRLYLRWTNWAGFAVAINVDCVVDIFSWLFIKFDIYMWTCSTCCCVRLYANLMLVHILRRRRASKNKTYNWILSVCLSIWEDKGITRHFNIISESRQKKPSIQTKQNNATVMEKTILNGGAISLAFKANTS